MDPLALVKLAALMELASGSQDVKIGLMDHNSSSFVEEKS
jgi:hypothetical protein